MDGGWNGIGWSRDKVYLEVLVKLECFRWRRERGEEKRNSGEIWVVVKLVN